MEDRQGRTLNFVLFITILLLAAWLVKVNYLDKATMVTVLGTGKVNVKPEIVTFTLNLYNYSASAGAAVSDNVNLVKNVSTVLKNNGLTDNDISTSYVRVVPPSTAGGQYQAVNTIDATLRNVSQFDSLFSALYGAGVQSITNIVFTTADSKTLEKQAVDLAIADAKARAKEMASATGKSLGRMISITTSETGEAGALSGTRTPSLTGQTQASPSQIEVSRQASVIFELK